MALLTRRAELSFVHVLMARRASGGNFLQRFVVAGLALDFFVAALQREAGDSMIEAGSGALFGE